MSLDLIVETGTPVYVKMKFMGTGGRAVIQVAIGMQAGPGWVEAAVTFKGQTRREVLEAIRRALLKTRELEGGENLQLELVEAV